MLTSADTHRSLPIDFDLPQKPGPKPTYPKTLTFTCANSCGGTVDVYLEGWNSRKRRYFCCEACRKEYSKRRHYASWEVRKTGRTGIVPAKSVVVVEPAKKRKHEEALRLGRW